MHSTSRRLLTSGLRAPPLWEPSRQMVTEYPSSTPLLLSDPSRTPKNPTRNLHIWLCQTSKYPFLPPISVRSNSTTAGGASEDEKNVADPAGKGQPISQEVQDELRQLQHIRTLVSQLHMALHVPDTYQTEMDNLSKQLEEIRAELQPLEEKKIQLLMRAERRSKLLAWAGLGFMGMQFGFLARLTWWEYSWDIIEPVTYFVTYGTAMALYAYFLVTRQDYSFPAVTERWTAVAFHKNVKRSKWEMTRYIQLKDKLTQMQTELEKMNMLLPRSSTSATAKQ